MPVKDVSQRCGTAVGPLGRRAATQAETGPGGPQPGSVVVMRDSPKKKTIRFYSIRWRQVTEA